MSSLLKPQTLRDPVLYLIERYLKREGLFTDIVVDPVQPDQEEPMELIYNSNKDLIQVKMLTKEINLNYLSNGDLNYAEVIDNGKNIKTTYHLGYNSDGDLVTVTPVLELIGSESVVME